MDIIYAGDSVYISPSYFATVSSVDYIHNTLKLISNITPPSGNQTGVMTVFRNYIATANNVTIYKSI